MTNIFEKRENLRPSEYPVCQDYMDAIHNAFWLVDEFNFTSDISDFKNNLTEVEKEAIKRCVLAISQIEVNVKDFWGDIGKHIQKPEIANTGHVFAGNEVIHLEAYAELLNVLGLNEEFEKIDDIPAIKDRMSYLNKVKDNGDFFKSLILFSLFIENVSLFSQFLIIMSFTKERNMLKGINNVVKATSKEENLHGKFGTFLINEMIKDKPELMTEELKKELLEFAGKAISAECKMIDWIFEEGELEFLPKEEVINFTLDRMKKSLEGIGVEILGLGINEEELEKLSWFDDTILTTGHVDFFNSRSVNYSKKMQSMEAEDLF